MDDFGSTEPVSLYSLATWTNGLAFRSIDFSSKGKPVIKIAEVKKGIGPQTKFTDASYDEKFRVRPGDMIFCWSGQPESSIGTFYWRGPEGWLNQHLFKVVPDASRVDYSYFYFLLQALLPQFVEMARNKQTTGLGHVTKKDLIDLHVYIPPLAEQRRIAGVLGALDDLIETNQRIRSTAEALGLALVRRVASKGFDIVDGAELEGWSLTSLGDISATLESGGRPKGGVAGIGTGVPSIGAESIKGLGQFDFSKTKFVPRSFVDTMKRGRLESRDVLVYKDGGKPGEFQPHVAMFGDGFPFDEMTINEHVYRVRAAPPLSNAYLYFWLSSRRIMDEMAMLGTGAAIPGLNSTAFKSLPVAIPPASVRDRLFPTLDALVAEALGAASEARDLSRARDELLPLLLSGRVSVREVAA